MPPEPSSATRAASGLQKGVLLLIFAASGAAALGYQVVWAKMLGTGLGHEFPAMLAVVTAFMGGMGAGAWFLHGRIATTTSPRTWYVALELIIGIWALMLAWGLPLINEHVGTWIGLDPPPIRHWLVAFAVPGLALLPATAAMGATFPAMERLLSQLWAGRGCVGAVYAANTVGAAFGSLVTVFVLAPRLGFRQTLWSLAAANLACAVAAMAMRPARAPPLPPPQTSQQAPQPGPLRGWLTLTGLLGIGYEVVGVRVLSQVLQDTIYTFAAVLAVYLVGTAAGAAIYQRWGRGHNFHQVLRLAVGGLALGVALEVWVLHGSESLYAWLCQAWPDSLFGAALAEMTVALAVFALPTVCMGALFSHLLQACKVSFGGVGLAVALNTLGGALAGLLFGVILFPVLGASWTLVLLVAGYASLMPRLRGWQWALSGMALLVAIGAPRPLRFVEVPEGGRLVRWEEGVMATVAVVEDAGRERTLRVDNRFQMGGTGAAAAEYRQAHLPLLLHPNPRRALFLGLGTGISQGAAILHPQLQSDGVELVPEVVEVLDTFEPANRGVRNHPAARILTADARRFVRNCSTQYDVIVGDLFHPARDGAGSLYAREHYAAMREVLVPGGVVCQWLPLHQIDTDTLRVIVRTFLDVFPDAQAWLLRLNVDAPVLGLISGAAPVAFDWIERRVEPGVLLEELRRLALADSIRFYGGWLAGPGALRAFAGNAPVHTDDRPHVTFDAPSLAYRKRVTPYASLLDVLALGGDDSDASIKPEDFARRLGAYRQARDVYLRALVDETEGQIAKAMDGYVESARLSADFTSGYARVVTFATTFATSRPQEARRLLQQLIQVRPEHPVAGQLRQKLFPE